MEKVGKNLAKTHQLSVLGGYLVDLAPMFRMRLQGDVTSLCDEVHSLDPSGQALRYSMVKDQGGAMVPGRPDLSTSTSPSSPAERVRRAPRWTCSRSDHQRAGLAGNWARIT